MSSAQTADRRPPSAEEPQEASRFSAEEIAQRRVAKITPSASRAGEEDAAGIYLSSCRECMGAHGGAW